MPENEERTFYFYSDGYLPQDLALGHLIFGTFVRPTKGRQCFMEPLSETDLDTWAKVQPRSKICYSSTSLRGFGISVTAIEMVTVGLSVNKDIQRAVTSERCRRITLKNPQQFLSEKVLAVDSTRETVQKWLSVSSHEYARLKLTPLRWWPKIWMLTGLYEFEDCTSFAWSKNDASVEANIAAEIMALLNIPFGAGSSVTNSRGRYTRETFPGKSVWAAEYQLVDAKFCRVQSNEMDKPATSLQLPLRLKAIYSRGTRGEETKRKEPDNMAVLCLTDEVSSEQGDTFESEDVFWEQFAKVEQTWEKRGHDIGE